MSDQINPAKKKAPRKASKPRKAAPSSASSPAAIPPVAAPRDACPHCNLPIDDAARAGQEKNAHVHRAAKHGHKLPDKTPNGKPLLHGDDVTEQHEATQAVAAASVAELAKK